MVKKGKELKEKLIEKIKDKLKHDIDFFLKISQIFASFAVGFGVILFSILSNISIASMKVIDYLKDIGNFTTEQVESLVDISRLNVFINLMWPFFYFFAFFLLLSMFSLVYAWHLKNKLDQISKKEIRTNIFSLN